MSTKMKRSAFLGVVAGTVLTMGLGGAALYGAGYGPVQQESHYLASGPEYASLRELTRASRLVVRARVAEAGKPYYVAFDPAVVVDDSAGATGGKGKDQGPPPTERSAARPTDPPSAADKGILKTDFSVEVLEVIVGDSVQAGQRLTVSQIGGLDDRGRPVSVEEDPLLKVGEQEVLFLARDPASQRFFTVGGGQGRFKIQPDGRALPVGGHSPLRSAASVNTLTTLREAIRASS
jgi:hypothetical protein